MVVLGGGAVSYEQGTHVSVHGSTHTVLHLGMFAASDGRVNQRARVATYLVRIRVPESASDGTSFCRARLQARHPRQHTVVMRKARVEGERMPETEVATVPAVL